MDSNQKMTRRTCCQLMSSVETVQGTNMHYNQHCGETPAFKAVFCRHHLAPPPGVRANGKRSPPEEVEITKRVCLDKDPRRLLQARSAGRTVALPPPLQLAGCLRAASVAAYRQRRGVQDVDTDACGDFVTCRTSKMPLRLNKRPGGWLLACTGDGVVTSLMEFYGGESLTQRAAFVAAIISEYPTVQAVVHDDACHLRRFTQRWFSDYPHLCYPAIRFIIDKFHYRGHRDSWCRANCAPTLPEHNTILQSVNTSRCEILFQWFSQYKHSFRHMSRLTGHFFVSELTDMHNAATAPAGKQEQEASRQVLAEG